jgi:hypothetical protein
MPVDQERVDSYVVEGVAALLGGTPVYALAPTTFSDALGYLFQRLLGEAPGWKRGWWIDGALAVRSEVIDNDTVSLAGTFVPADHKDQWIQPFKADLTVDERRLRLAGYHVHLGEAGMPINAVPYHRPRTHWPDAQAWAFEFRWPDVPPAMELIAWRTWYKQTGERRLRKVVLEQWDPIGVGQDSPTEYDAYLLQIAGLLRRGGTAKELEGLLRSLSLYQMGAPGPERDRTAALAIHAWYGEAMRDAAAASDTGDVSHRPAPTSRH